MIWLSKSTSPYFLSSQLCEFSLFSPLSQLICQLSFLGLSQTLPVTSYVKMLDIWLIFTMIVPFIEVAMHACNQHLKKRTRVAPTMILTKIGSETLSFETLSRVLLPLVSVLFSAGFWILGFLVSLWLVSQSSRSHSYHHILNHRHPKSLSLSRFMTSLTLWKDTKMDVGIIF